MLTKHLSAQINDRARIAASIERQDLAARIDHAKIKVVASLIADADNADLLARPKCERELRGSTAGRRRELRSGFLMK